MAVLGISANSRVVGLAVIDSGILLDYRIHLFTERWSDDKACRIIESLQSCLTDFPITSIAILIPHVHYASPQTNNLITRIQAHCSTQKSSVSTYQAAALHNLCEASKKKKKALMKVLAERYPDLRYVHAKELRNKNKYYHKLFEAVGAATLFELHY